MDMYCPQCDLKIAGESASECPICGTGLISELEAGLAEESAAEKLSTNRGADGGSCDLEALLASPGDEIEFDPEALGLTRTPSGEEGPGDEDISVLAEMWNEEDIGAELDRVLGEAMTPVDTVGGGRQSAAEPGPAGKRPAVGSDKMAAADFDGIFAGMREDTPGPAGPAAPEPEEEEPPVLFEPAGSPPEERGHGPLILIVVVLLVIGGVVGGYLYWAGQKKSTVVKRPVSSLATTRVEDKIFPVPPSAPTPAPDKTAPVPAPVKAPEKASVKVAPKTVGHSQGLAAKPLPAGSKPESATTAGKVEKTAAEPPAAPVGNKPEAKNKPKTQAKAQAGKQAKSRAPVAHRAQKTAAAAPSVNKPLVVKKNPAPAKKMYAVHVGSFTSPEKARGQAARFRRAGFKSARVVKVDLRARGIWYRVLIPVSPNQAEAVKTRLRFKHKFPGEPSRIIKLGK